MFKKEKERFLRGLNKCEKAYKSTTLSVMTIIVISMVNIAYATPKLITGTVSLFTAVTSWLLIIIPTGAGAVLGYHALQKSLSDDQAVVAEKNKQMKNVIIGAAIAETASGLVTILLNFYK